MTLLDGKSLDLGSLGQRAWQLLLFLLVPGGLLLLAALLFVQSGLLLHWLAVIAMASPYLVLGAALLLGWRFNRSRLVFAVLVLVLADLLFFHACANGDLVVGHARQVYDAIALLLPLNLLLLYFVPEKGLFSVHGLWRLIVIGLQPAFFDFLLKSQPGFAPLLAMNLVNWPWLKNLQLPQPGLAMFLVALLLFGLMLIKHRGNREHGFLWATITAAIALAAGRPGSATTILLATAGLILVVTLVEDAYCMAFRDELTGLPARRALNEAMQMLPGQYTVAMLDIDFFKKFNDTHGHDVGDQVLCMVAARLDRVRGGGKAFRYGGEEFTVLFSGRGVKEVLPFLEELRQSVEEAGFYIRHPQRPRRKPESAAPPRSGKRVSVTISIGAAEPASRKETPQQVIKQADKALYRAKKKGRNQVAS